MSFSGNKPINETILYDRDGYAIAVRDGYSSTLYPSSLLISGLDKNNTVKTIKTLDNGVLQNKYYELATFNAIAKDIETSQNKSLFSILNQSNKIIRIEEIYLINVRVANITGVSGLFEIHRMTNHTSGISINNIESYETSDILDSNITIKSDASIFGESSNILWRNIFSTDEYKTSNLDTGNMEKIFQTMFPIFYKKTNNSKTITLKNNEGLSLKFISNSSTGLFDIFCIFTQE